MSRNGVAARSPSLRSWIAPRCSTTYRRCASPGELTTCTGAFSPLATGVAWTAAWGALGAVAKRAISTSVHARRGDITWRYTQLRAKLFHSALPRLLVGPPALELGAVAYAVAADVIEGDLDDELRSQSLPDELLVRLPAAGLAGAALAGHVRLQGVDQLALLLGREARGVAHDVKLILVVVEAED